MNDRYAKTAVRSRDEKTSGPSNDIEIRPTICSICNPGSHCGVDAYVKNERIVKIKGNLEAHNAGMLCAKGAAGLQYVYHPDRLTTPLIRTGDRGDGQFEPASWQDASVLFPTGPHGGYKPSRRPEADVNTLIDPDYRDPISGFPALKSLLCEVKKAPVAVESLE